jgi:hypothetical protein
MYKKKTCKIENSLILISYLPCQSGKLINLVLWVSLQNQKGYHYNGYISSWFWVRFGILELVLMQISSLKLKEHDYDCDHRIHEFQLYTGMLY